MFERLLREPPYSLRQREKEAILLEGLNELTRYHYEQSPEYARILDADGAVSRPMAIFRRFPICRSACSRKWS